MLDEAGLHEYFRALCGGIGINELPRHMVNIHLKSGLDAAVDALGYSRETDPYSLALVEGQYEYPLSSDVHQVTWIHWNNRQLTQASVEDWNRRQLNWRGATSGTPSEVAIDGRALYVYPPPDDDAIEDDGFIVYRFLRQFVLTPAGISGMPDADARVAVQIGALEWLGANNADGRHNNRIASVRGLLPERIAAAGARAQQPFADHFETIPCFSTMPFLSR